MNRAEGVRALAPNVPCDCVEILSVRAAFQEGSAEDDDELPPPEAPVTTALPADSEEIAAYAASLQRAAWTGCCTSTPMSSSTPDPAWMRRCTLAS